MARIWAANGTPRSTLTEHKFDVDAVARLPRTTRPWPVIAEHAPGRLPGSGHRWGWRVTVAGRSQEVTRARGDRGAGPARPGIMGARFRSSFHPDHARRRRRAQAAPGAELTGRAAPGAAPAIRAPSRFLLGSLSLPTCPPMPCQAVLEPGAPGRTRAGWPTLSVLIPAPVIPRCGGMTGGGMFRVQLISARSRVRSGSGGRSECRMDHIPASGPHSESSAAPVGHREVPRRAEVRGACCARWPTRKWSPR
jgi:hypothetical protein